MTGRADSLAFDIYCIDNDYIRPRLACSYLIVNRGKAAFIDCGTSHSVTNLLGAIKQSGLQPTDIDYVIPTHIHLDHAGGASSLMHMLPNAILVVHPRGARHMIDPQRLVESAQQVYGYESFKQLYGEIEPIDESRVHAANDNEILNLNGRHLEIAHTPGHARHHFCIYDEMSHGWFTGDTFGLSYPDVKITDGSYLLPTTTPVQFEYDAWLSSLDILLSKNPHRMYLTHFGMLEDIQKYATKLKHDLYEYTEIANSVKNNADRINKLKQKLTQFTLDDLKSLGCSQGNHELIKLLEMDMTLNAQGLDVWLSRQEQS